MSLSITPTLPVHGEPEATPTIRPEGLAASYSSWVDAAEALIAAQHTEALSFDDLIVTIGRANLDTGLSLRAIADAINSTGKKMPVITDEGKVDRIKPTHTTIDRWVSIYVVMRDGDVTSAVAKALTTGMGNSGFPTPAEVRKVATGASTDGGDVLNAVRGAFSAARKAKEDKEPKPEPVFDGAKTTKKLGENTAELLAHREELTVDDKANIMATIVRLQSLVA